LAAHPCSGGIVEFVLEPKIERLGVADFPTASSGQCSSISVWIKVIDRDVDMEIAVVVDASATWFGRVVEAADGLG
jgi:hypothetical protein